MLGIFQVLIDREAFSSFLCSGFIRDADPSRGVLCMAEESRIVISISPVDGRCVHGRLCIGAARVSGCLHLSMSNSQWFPAGRKSLLAVHLQYTDSTALLAPSAGGEDEVSNEAGGRGSS